MARKANSQYPAPPKNWTAPQPSSEGKEKDALFIHSCLDDYGLSPLEFRVLCHVARRESKNRGCDASQGRMAQTCGISQRKVLEILGILVEANLLSQSKAPGKRTNRYRVNYPSKWKHPSQLEAIRQRRLGGKSKDEDLDGAGEAIDLDDYGEGESTTETVE